MLGKFLIVFQLLHAHGTEYDAVLKTSAACVPEIVSVPPASSLC
jgi:hypothetical protein